MKPKSRPRTLGLKRSKPTARTGRRYQPGDYVCIPLCNTRNAFMRLFPDCKVGVSSATTPKAQTGLPDQQGKIVLFASWASNAFRGKPKWEIVRREPFKNKAESHVPPCYIGDAEWGYELMYQGERLPRPATKKTSSGNFLEKCSRRRH